MLVDISFSWTTDFPSSYWLLCLDSHTSTYCTRSNTAQSGHTKFCFHDDVNNGNIFRVTGHLCGEFTGPGEFPTQRSVARSFDVFFDLHLNKRLRKQWWGWWFETPSLPFWRHRNVVIFHAMYTVVYNKHSCDIYVISPYKLLLEWYLRLIHFWVSYTLWTHIDIVRIFQVGRIISVGTIDFTSDRIDWDSVLPGAHYPVLKGPKNTWPYLQCVGKYICDIVWK